MKRGENLAALNEKRRELMWERNAWCIKCQQPMRKHGKHFRCAACQWTTQIQGTSQGRTTFASCSLNTTGQQRRFNPDRLSYPYCIHCRRRMVRLSRRAKGFPLMYRCLNCKASTVSHSDAKGRFEDKKREAVRMLREGYPLTEISLVLKIHLSTLHKLEPEVVRKRCKCGQVALHKRKCSKRAAREYTPTPPKWVTEATVLAGRLGKGRKNQKGEVKVIDLRRAFEKSGMSKSELAARLGWVKPSVDRVNRALGYRTDSDSRGVKTKPRQTMTYELALLIARAMNADYREVGL